MHGAGSKVSDFEFSTNLIFSIKVSNLDKYRMTKRIEEILNLDNSSSSKKTVKPIDEEIAAKAEEVKSVEQSLAAISETTKNLPQIAELNDLDDGELDELASKAEQAYDDLMDLGMNVEVRYAGRIFEVAGSMMKNAIDAKSAKIEKKLKAVDLQLKKYKIDKDSPDESNNVLNGEGYIITDRNELLKKLGQR